MGLAPALVGQLIPIAAHVHDDDATLFARASIRDKTNSHVIGSPFTLSNLGGGDYGISTFTYPDTDFINVRIEFFLELAFTNKSPNHPDAVGCYFKDGLSDAIAALVTASRRSDLDAEFKDEKGVSFIVKDTKGPIELEIDEKKVILQVKDKTKITLEVNDKSGLDAEVGDC